MQEITVGTKNQIVIPKTVRVKIKGLKPGRKVSVYPLDEETVIIKVSPKNWVERTAGMMSQAWRGRDPIQELEDMRDEWEERLREYEKITR